MPYFDYHCNVCCHEWEWLGKWADRPPLCEKCKALNIERLPSYPSKVQHREGEILPSLTGRPVKSFANDRRKGGKDTT